jgi:hypothetical protein
LQNKKGILALYKARMPFNHGYQDTKTLTIFATLFTMVLVSIISVPLVIVIIAVVSSVPTSVPITVIIPTKAEIKVWPIVP